MAGFRLWEDVTIEQLLDRLTEGVLETVRHEYIEISLQFEKHLEHNLKRVLNETMYASPACGTSSMCAPSEEGRAKPWSPKSASWGLVTHADPTLDH